QAHRLVPDRRPKSWALHSGDPFGDAGEAPARRLPHRTRRHAVSRTFHAGRISPGGRGPRHQGGARMTLPLYRRLLGERFDALPQRVRELHELTGPATWRGRADVERGTSWVARAMATLLSFPSAGRD